MVEHTIRIRCKNYYYTKGGKAIYMWNDMELIHNSIKHPVRPATICRGAPVGYEAPCDNKGCPFNGDAPDG